MVSSFLMLKVSAKFQRGRLQRGRQIEVGYVQIGHFSTYISLYITNKNLRYRRGTANNSAINVRVKLWVWHWPVTQLDHAKIINLGDLDLETRFQLQQATEACSTR